MFVEAECVLLVVSILVVYVKMLVLMLSLIIIVGVYLFGREVGIADDRMRCCVWGRTQYDSFYVRKLLKLISADKCRQSSSPRRWYRTPGCKTQTCVAVCPLGELGAKAVVVLDTDDWSERSKVVSRGCCFGGFRPRV